ncbi:hypothetical protein NQ314_009530 [Rhamnusium bicolor]|uniref:MADF domain-containing protein n=1 Tax=Rhamnusium bicolor TaxID=1586634 RepID=A0AAV8XYG9_9CUCU|nr:hypothetical protein NQ314_009530 [Rhamnusium bicolor]
MDQHSVIVDQHKFVAIIRYFPQIWDRTHPQFRDKDAKDCAWEVIGTKIGCTGDACRETFKSIREKYIREREKSVQYGENYRQWDLLPKLKFLDPNIVPRKQSVNNEEDTQKAEEFRSKLDLDTSFVSLNQTDFDKALIALVKKTTPIWDRNCNTYPNKQLKNQLWQTIATKLNKDTNSCMLRWKALREKYIRQKTKYQQEGDAKWELLDDMIFLDKVIQYRRKQSDSDFDNKRTSYNDNTSMYNNFQPILPRQNEVSQESAYNYETGDDNSMNDSSSDYPTLVKQENPVYQLADSSYAAGQQSSLRKRSTSINSEPSIEKKSKTEETDQKEKTPEQLFGDLVAAMLSKKPEKNRNLYMIEIMTVLSK